MESEMPKPPRSDPYDGPELEIVHDGRPTVRLIRETELDQRIAVAVEAERKACEEIARKWLKTEDDCGERGYSGHIAEAIAARGRLREIKLEPGWLAKDMVKATERIHPDHRGGKAKMSETDEIAGRLRAGLEDVTPGPWLASAIGITSIKTNETVVDGCGVQRPIDEQHIANCDPQSILAILDERDLMKAEIERIKLAPLRKVK